jgi:hypothetical protein
MKTDFVLPKKLDWTQLNLGEGFLRFDCPKCLQSVSVTISIFNKNDYHESNGFKLTNEKFGYTSKEMVILANIIAFGITLVILFGLLGDLMQSDEYGKMAYLLGIPIMLVFGRILIPLFRKTMPVWLLKCEDCGEWIILASNGEEVHLARETEAKKQKQTQDNSPYAATVSQQERKSTTKTSNEAAIWDLKNGDKKAKGEAALSLLHSKDPNAAEIILNQILIEKPEDEDSSFFSTSVKEDLLMNLAANIKKIRTPKTVDAYINVLPSNDVKVIAHALVMLENLGSKRAIEPLESLAQKGVEGLKPGAVEKTIIRIKKKNGIAT